MRIPTALIGCHVDRTAFDYQVRLSLSALEPGEGNRVDAELVIETPFQLRDHHGNRHELDPGTGSRLAPALDLFRRTVTAVDVPGEGALQLIFDDGAELHVSPHPESESWS